MTDETEAFEAAEAVIVSDSRDWSVRQADALTWALLVGWGCEEHHEHDDMCGGDEALVEVADRHGWPQRLRESIQAARAVIKAVTE